MNWRVNWKGDETLTVQSLHWDVEKKSRWREEHFYLLHRMEYDVAGWNNN